MQREIEWTTYGATVIHPLALGFTLLMGIGLLVVRRDRALLAIMLVACLIPIMQRIAIATIDFNMIRILLLFAWARVFMKGELRGLKWNKVDTAFTVWLVVVSVIYVIRVANFGAVIYRAGIMVDGLGTYLFVRVLIQRDVDITRAAKSFAYVSIAVAAAMFVENLTGRNAFSVFGGVAEITVVRDGRLRCQGAFTHPIMAGSFGASLIPLFIGLFWTQKRGRLFSALACISAMAIVFFSSSSGPAIAGITAFVGMSMWIVRKQMQPIRWAMVGTATVLHFIREAPVWHLIGRLSDLVGGTGYHRYRLIDAFIVRYREWMVLGLNGTGHWGWGLQDITNQFVLEGVRGGILGLSAFIAMLTYCYQAVGRTMKRMRRVAGANRQIAKQREIWAWVLGVVLTTHMLSWISVSYFGQMRIIFFMHLAILSSLSVVPLPKRKVKPEAKTSVLPSNPDNLVSALTGNGARA